MSNETAIPRRQVALPLSKAIEISWKSIRLRLSRSLLVTSAIVLALAFLSSILTTETLLDGMRRWAQAWPTSAEYAQLKRQRDAQDVDYAAGVGVLRVDADTAKPDANARKFSAREVFDGSSWDALRAQAGALPLPAADLDKLLTARPDRLPEVRRLLELARSRRAIREQLNRPEDVKAALTRHGVPTDPADIAANAIQTRWVIGLALLVAFVGILNAMLMSVTERFREIGTMKCLGALDRFIIKLFLLESLFQGVVGTLLGMGVGMGVSIAMAKLSYGQAAFFDLSWGGLMRNAGVTLAVGLGMSVSGAILPAWQAARMEPIAAMRAEQ